MRSALIGSTGFVGGTLLRQRAFDAAYHSTDIDDICGRSFDLVVCAGAPAQKWLANREPDTDARGIDRLIARLDAVHCGTMVLISTVDVFLDPVDVDESTPVQEAGLQPYGLHRLRLEQFITARFPSSLVVRLPGLVGSGLRKNVLYDFHNSNALDMIDSRNVYQFYPMDHLWHDISIALDAGLSLVHLTAAPLSVGEVAAEGFDLRFTHTLDRDPVRYDMQTRHGALYDVTGRHQHDREASLAAIRRYAQTEPRSQVEGGA